MARVRVSEDTWAEFRRLAGAKSVSEVLGRLVEREVSRVHRKTAEKSSEVLEAVREARALRDEFEALAERLERQSKSEGDYPDWARH
jgi:predicted CopG family antitoxin